MSSVISMTIDGKSLKAASGQTLLEVCKKNKIDLPTLCEFEGLGSVGACRLCLVEVEGTPKLLPACTTPAAENQKVRTTSERLEKYRRMIVELFFSERNHPCSVCVANRHCELQTLGYRVGMEHVRFPFLFQECYADASHEDFILDQNRCILCTRCVRVCEEVEGAHHWDVMGRGYRSRVIGDFNQPWAESVTCTSCGKCVEVCPTGALWPKRATMGKLDKKPELVAELAVRRKVNA